MYRGRYEREAPPGYSGVAFAPPREEAAEKGLKSSPTPVESGAGDNAVLRDNNTYPFVSKASKDQRNEIKTLPRNFSGTGMAESEAIKTAKLCDAPEKEDGSQGYAELSSLFHRKVSLEDLLLVGTALLLATKDEKDEAFPMFALLLMLLGS